MTNKKQLVIFIKAPIIGQCKTRLIPLLGEQAATEFYKHLASHCVNTANQLSDIDIALYTYPDTRHSFIQQLNNSNSTSLHSQQGNNLGERMYNAINTSLKTYSQCVLIGSDCPGITADYIEQAFSALDSHSITLGPATDGGYVLIGSKKISPEIFANTQWSSHTVLQQCLKNINQLNYSHVILPELWDIDTPHDFIQHQLQIERLLNRQYNTRNLNNEYLTIPGAY